jgi:hypothetical protein
MRTKLLQLIFVFAAAALTSTAQTVTPFSEHGKTGYKDATGQVVIPAMYRSAGLMVPNGKSGDFYTVVSYEGKFGYINQKGEVLIPFMYETADLFREGLARVKQNGKYGYINMNNQTIIPFDYEYAGKVSNGMARVEKNNKWGFINVSTKATEIPLTYQNANDFSEGLASVQGTDGLWGFINAQGSYVIAPQFQKAESFKNGKVLVHNGNAFIEINTTGQVVSNAR